MMAAGVWGWVRQVAADRRYDDRGIGGLGFVLIAGAVVVAVLVLVAAYDAVLSSETDKIQVEG